MNMPKVFLHRSHPTLFFSYQGVTVAALGTGLASALADSSTIPPPILSSFYNWLSINIWGYIYLVVGVILIVGFYSRKVARAGLALILLLLSIRLGFQLQQAVILWQDGATFRELLPTIAGLPILYAFVSSVLAMTMEPFSNPSTSPDITVVSMSDGNGHNGVDDE